MQRSATQRATHWEALAILVALRCWRQGQDASIMFQMRSDSLSAFSSILKAFSRSANLNNIVAEILLDGAELYNAISATVHIPGIANIQPDALSRLPAPAPCEFPPAFLRIHRESLRPRDSSFWLTPGPGVANSNRKRLPSTGHRKGAKTPDSIPAGV
jgi:hypothetical protein